MNNHIRRLLFLLMFPLMLLVPSYIFSEPVESMDYAKLLKEKIFIENKNGDFPQPKSSFLVKASNGEEYFAGDSVFKVDAYKGGQSVRDLPITATLPKGTSFTAVDKSVAGMSGLNISNHDWQFYMYDEDYNIKRQLQSKLLK